MPMFSGNWVASSKPNTVTTHTGQIGNVMYTHRHTSRDADANSPSESVPVNRSNPSGGWFSYFQGFCRRNPPTPQIRWVLEIKTEYVNRSGSKVEDSIELEFSSKEEAENHARKWGEKNMREGRKVPYVINIYLKGHPPPQGQSFQPNNNSYADTYIRPPSYPMLPNVITSVKGKANSTANASTCVQRFEQNAAKAIKTDKLSERPKGRTTSTGKALLQRMLSPSHSTSTLTNHLLRNTNISVKRKASTSADASQWEQLYGENAATVPETYQLSKHPKGQAFKRHMSSPDLSLCPSTNPVLPKKNTSVQQKARASVDASKWQQFDEQNAAAVPKINKPKKP